MKCCKTLSKKEKRTRTKNLYKNRKPISPVYTRYNYTVCVTELIALNVFLFDEQNRNFREQF